MTTSPTLPNAGPYADHQNKPPTRLGRIGMWLVVGVGIASGLLWAGAIIWGSAADPKPVNWKEDRAFFEAAEPICKAAIDEIDTYPLAHESETPADRAVVIRQTTGVITNMIAELRGLVPEGEDGEWITMWLDDYGTHTQDRLAFADKLDGPDGEQQEFYESVKADKQISVSLNEFAKQNEMYSCETPGDV